MRMGHFLLNWSRWNSVDSESQRTAFCEQGSFKTSACCNPLTAAFSYAYRLPWREDLPVKAAYSSTPIWKTGRFSDSLLESSIWPIAMWMMCCCLTSKDKFRRRSGLDITAKTRPFSSAGRPSPNKWRKRKEIDLLLLRWKTGTHGFQCRWCNRSSVLWTKHTAKRIKAVAQVAWVRTINRFAASKSFRSSAFRTFLTWGCWGISSVWILLEWWIWIQDFQRPRVGPDCPVLVAWGCSVGLDTSRMDFGDRPRDFRIARRTWLPLANRMKSRLWIQNSSLVYWPFVCPPRL